MDCHCAKDGEVCELDAQQRKKLTTSILRLLQNPEAEKILRNLLSLPQSHQELTESDAKSVRVIPYYLIRTLAGTALAVSAAGAITEMSFTWRAALLFGGLVALAADPWIEPSVRKIHALYKGAASCFFLVLLAVFLKYVVFLPSPLVITARDYNGDYEDGRKIAGIAWKPKYSDLRVVFSNPTDRDYEHIDVVVGAGMYIADAKPSTNMPGVSVFKTSAGPDNVTVPRKDSSGHVTYEPEENVLFVSGGVKVICDKLPRGTSFEIVLALVTIPSAGNLSSPPSSDNLLVMSAPGIQSNPAIFGPRTPAKTIGISGWFQSLGHRPHRVRDFYEVKQL